MAKKRVAARGKRDGRTNPTPWTKEHVRDLKKHSRVKTPVAVISKAMKRTVGALRQQARKLGLPLGHRR